MIGSTYRLRDSRLVEFTLPESKSGWQFETLKLQIGPLKSKLPERLPLIENGKNLFENRSALQSSGDFTARLNGRGFLNGSLMVSASCKDQAGEIHRWEADYNDIADIAFSTTGPDNVRDDKNYLELIEAPIKSFLEDPDNALPDGTLLKDHILFFVIAYGLPRTCIAPYGIERGITKSINNFGPIIDLGQRLQLMYYDIEAVSGTTPGPYRFDIKTEAFTTFYLRTPQSLPLYGPKANPFLHPRVYKKDKHFDTLEMSVNFSSANRKNQPEKHLYFAMRIDAADPVQAKSLIDRAAYAKKYAASHMGVIPGTEIVKSDSTTGKLKYNSAGPALWDYGFKRIYYRYTSSNRLELFRLPSNAGFYNTEPVYLPGGIAATVTSNSGWNRKKSAIYDYIDKGVTVTLGAARVYEGAPHIHSKSWWDDAVFYNALIHRKTIGEALLMNQTHLGWISVFIGDPLYKLPAENPKIPQDLAIEKIRLISLPSKPDAVALAVKLKSSTHHPQMAQMRITGKGKEAYTCSTFESTPYVILEKNIVESTGKWQIRLMDPFGRKKQTDFTFEQLEKTGL